MDVTFFPWVAVIVGLILWAIPWPAPAAKLSEAGKIIFAVGVFWVVGGKHGPALSIR